MSNGLVKRGRYWNFDFWFKKKRHQGSTQLSNHEKAKIWLSAYRTNLAMTGVGLVEKEAPPLLATFLNGAFTKHVEQQNTNPRTAYCYKKKIKLLAEYAPFKVKTLDQIGELEIQAFKDWRLAKKLRPATINGDLRVLRKALKFADKCGLIRYRGLTVLPGETNRIFVVSAELEKAYLAAATYPLHEIAILMLDLGVRPEEAVSLRKADVSTQSVNVRSGKTANATRSLPQTERTRAIFELCTALFPDSPWVFPGRKKGAHLTAGRVSMAHIELRDKFETRTEGAAANADAVITHSRIRDVPSVAMTAHAFPREFVLYSLRHTFATRLSESGAREFEMKAALGHSDIRVSQKYVHPSQASITLAFKRKEAMDRLVRSEEVTTKITTVPDEVG